MERVALEHRQHDICRDASRKPGLPQVTRKLDPFFLYFPLQLVLPVWRSGDREQCTVSTALIARKR